MKKVIFYFLSLLIFTACQTDSNTAQQASAVPSASSTPAPATEKREPVHVPASTLAPLIGMWHYEAVTVIKDVATQEAYIGRWIDLKGDQSFTSGKWQEQTNTGKWSFDTETQQINFYYEQAEDIFDEFIVQGVGGETIIFKGHTPRTQTGIQIKMVRYPGRSTQ